MDVVEVLRWKKFYNNIISSVFCQKFIIGCSVTGIPFNTIIIKYNQPLNH